MTITMPEIRANLVPSSGKSEHFSQILQEFGSDYINTNIKFVCGTSSQQYHKAVVANNSDILHNILTGHSCPESNVVIFLDNINIDILKVVMDCLYTGRSEDISDKLLEEVHELKNILGFRFHIGVEDNNNANSKLFEIEENICASGSKQICVDLASNDRADGDSGNVRSLEAGEIELSDNIKTNTRNILIKHASQKRLFLCEKCHYQAKTAQFLKRHIINKHNAVGHPCGQCHKLLKSKESLERHTVLKHKEKICDQCPYQSKDRKSLKRHIITTHGAKLYTCDQCAFQSKDRGYLKSHIISKHDETLFICDICSFEAQNPIGLRRHITRQHDEAIFKCDKCVYKTAYRHIFDLHIKSHENAIYFCDQCPHQVATRESLDNHIEYQHEPPICYECKDCTNKFSRKVSVTSHQIQLKHSKIDYSCYQCDLKSEDREQMKQHVNLSHEFKYYVCHYCKYQSLPPHDHERHIDDIHVNIKGGLVCDQCDFEPTPGILKTRKAALNRHKLVKHEGRIFSCNKCNYKASYATHLRRHRDSVHEGIKYNCEECEYQATQAGNLKIHVKSQHRNKMVLI